MKIQCDNGLCDRLRFIFSYYSKLKKNENLTVCWKINKKCNGHFLDIFEPIKNLKFTDDNNNVDIFGWKPYKNLGIHFSKTNIYNNIYLLPEIKQKTYELAQKMNKYISIHIRRTDKSLRHKNLTRDESFIEFINETKHNIFLATDCYHVQNKFKEIFNNRLFYFEEIEKPWNYSLKDCITDGSDHFNPERSDFRPKSLKATAIDLFTCIYSNNFMGTNLSGMSDFIYYNRKYVANKKLI
jgi:hypothetical protein